jgi:hypothetical protein
MRRHCATSPDVFDDSLPATPKTRPVLVGACDGRLCRLRMRDDGQRQGGEMKNGLIVMRCLSGDRGLAECEPPRLGSARADQPPSTTPARHRRRRTTRARAAQGPAQSAAPGNRARSRPCVTSTVATIGSPRGAGASAARAISGTTLVDSRHLAAARSLRSPREMSVSPQLPPCSSVDFLSVDGSACTHWRPAALTAITPG